MKKLIIPTIFSLAVITILVMLQLDKEAESPTYTLPIFRTTSQIRDAVGREVDWGTQSTQLNMKVFTNDSEELSRIFRNDEGAVMCQGAAYYLHLKYLDAGYRSYLVGFQSRIFSHTMVLVEIERKDGTQALIVQDPSFNLSYVDSTGKALSVFEIMSHLASGNHEAILVKEGAPADVEFLRHPLDPDPIGSIYVKEFVGPSKENSELLEYKATISFNAFSNALFRKVKVFCAIKGVGNSILYGIFDRPIYVYKRYPMNPRDKADAEQVFNLLEEHYLRLNNNKEG
jgi:hypothetical protein